MTKGVRQAFLQARADEGAFVNAWHQSVRATEKHRLKRRNSAFRAPPQPLISTQHSLLHWLAQDVSSHGAHIYDSLFSGTSLVCLCFDFCRMHRLDWSASKSRTPARPNGRCVCFLRDRSRGSHGCPCTENRTENGSSSPTPHTAAL